MKPKGMKPPIRTHAPTKPRKAGMVARPPKGQRKLSMKSQVDRMMFFALKNQTLAEQERQAAQQEQLSLMHMDLGAAWDGSSTGLNPSTLMDPSTGTGAGSTLTGSGQIPPEFQAPQ